MAASVKGEPSMGWHMICDQHSQVLRGKAAGAGTAGMATAVPLFGPNKLI